MALEDIAMFRSIPGSTVFYPSDAVSTEYAVELAANTPGMCFIRTSRPENDVIYPNDEVFEIGKAKVISESGIQTMTVYWFVNEIYISTIIAILSQGSTFPGSYTPRFCCGPLDFSG